MPFRADGFRLPGVQVSWLADRRPRPPSRGLVPPVASSDGGSSLTVARQLRFLTGFPWCPTKILIAGVGRH